MISVIPYAVLLVSPSTATVVVSASRGTYRKGGNIVHRNVHYNILGSLLLATMIMTLGSCKYTPTKPSDKVYHGGVFNRTENDCEVQNVNSDFSGQDGWVFLAAGTGVAGYDWYKYKHTLVFRTIRTHDVFKTVPNLEPNSIESERSFGGVDNLDWTYDLGSGRFQSAVTPNPDTKPVDK